MSPADRLFVDPYFRPLLLASIHRLLDSLLLASAQPSRPFHTVACLPREDNPPLDTLLRDTRHLHDPNRDRRCSKDVAKALQHAPASRFKLPSFPSHQPHLWIAVGWSRLDENIWTARERHQLQARHE